MTDYATIKVNKSMAKKEIMDLFYELQEEYNDRLEEIKDLNERVSDYDDHLDLIKELYERLTEANQIRGNLGHKLGDARKQIQDLEDSILKQENIRQASLVQIHCLQAAMVHKNRQILQSSEELKKVKHDYPKQNGKIA